MLSASQKTVASDSNKGRGHKYMNSRLLKLHFDQINIKTGIKSPDQEDKTIINSRFQIAIHIATKLQNESTSSIILSS
jgi:hypothetical protein